MWYLSRKIRLVKPDVIYARRKARQGKVPKNLSPYAAAAESQNVFNPNASESNIPLNQTEYQQWDSNGHAIGYSGDPRFNNMYQPEPHHAQPQMYSYREDSGGMGTTYPKGLTDGRSPVRQESSESGHSGTPPQRRETFDLPRVASPEDAGANFDNPFEHDPPFVPPSGPPPPAFPAATPHLQSPQSYAPYASSQTHQGGSVRDSHLPNPFDDPNQPVIVGHMQEATGDSYLANDGHSREGTSARAPNLNPPLYPDSSLR